MRKLISILFLAFGLGCTALTRDMIKSAGSVFINSAGEKTEVALSGRITGFYLSGSGSDGKNFTPKLVEFYSGLKKAGYNFEVIFVSANKNAAEMMQYMREFNMPWPAVPYVSEEAWALKRIMQTELGITNFPRLIIVRDGQVLTINGRADIQKSGLEAYQKWLTMVPEPVSLPPAENKTALSSRPTQSDPGAAAGPLPAPYKKEMDMNELKRAVPDLDGEIVKTSIAYVEQFEQVNEVLYRALCGHLLGTLEDGGKVEYCYVLIPIEGKRLFQSLSKKDIAHSGVERDQTVYLRVHSKSPIKAGRYSYQLEAVGVRYSPIKNEYSW